MPKSSLVGRIVHSKEFERFAVIVILLNAALTGVALSGNTPTIDLVQEFILAFFVLEIFMRMSASSSAREYISDPWNWFDVIVVGVSYLPEAWFDGAEISVVRTLRVLRIFRVLREVEELRIITGVLLKSIKSLGYSGILFMIFMYVYAVIGVSVFRQENYAKSVNAGLNPSNPDPYGSLGEAMFTLFRILTGEDWTDLRYNLLNLHPNQDVMVTVFHVSWMVLSAFLLVNLVVGAVVNNYDRTMEEVRAERDEELEEEKAEQD
jgi:voltage-gated sodium channel